MSFLLPNRFLQIIERIMISTTFVTQIHCHVDKGMTWRFPFLALLHRQKSLKGEGCFISRKICREVRKGEERAQRFSLQCYPLCDMWSKVAEILPLLSRTLFQWNGNEDGNDLSSKIFPQIIYTQRWCRNGAKGGVIKGRRPFFNSTILIFFFFVIKKVRDYVT